MAEIGSILVAVFREAWQVFVLLIAAFAVLIMLSQALKASASAAVGGSRGMAQAVSGIVGVLFLALFAFLGVPSIVRAMSNAIPSGSCGPISELGGIASMTIGALAALRMIKAVFSAIVSGIAGGSIGVSEALLETGEAMFGMVVASIAIPIAARFLGGC
ncbi:MAG: hypothetical protein HPY45_09770 [Anaerolineae bacterium]|nr:hypothetical protein [Anaerolineae bacterium]